MTKSDMITWYKNRIKRYKEQLEGKTYDEILDTPYLSYCKGAADEIQDIIFNLEILLND